MIIPKDICCGEIVEVHLDNEECLAKVLSNESNYLFVTYFYQTDKMYKGTGVYSFDSQAQRVDFENLTSHYIDTIDIIELGFKKIGKNMYVIEVEIDSDSASEIETDESSDESESDDFVASEDTDGVPPSDYKTIDDEWNKWVPDTDGAQRFKDTVNRIEARVRHALDEKKLFTK
jgi:hypothetical protein